MTSPRIRKPVSELSIADLDRFPVWEFALDEEGLAGQDETTVRPVHVRGTLDPSGRTLIVRARFQLADGTGMAGYLTPRLPPDDDLGSLQPVIVSDNGHVLFWHGVIRPEPEHIRTLYGRLGKTSHMQVFPIRFVSDFPIEGDAIRGEIHGFTVLEDWRTNRIRVLT